MNRISDILSSLTCGKYIPKHQKTELTKITEKLVDTKYEKLVIQIKEIIETNKLRKKMLETLTELINELKEQGITTNEACNLIEEAIREIEDENLEKELDAQCDRYNKFTESKPAQNISYHNGRQNYVLEYENKEKASKKLSKLVSLLKENLTNLYKEKLIESKIHKYYDNKLVSYIHSNKELFDINHIINILDHKCKRDKYQRNKKYIKYYSFKDNSFGGFYIKEYIEREDIKHIVINNRKTGMIKLLELIGENIVYKIPVEIETLKILIEVFRDFEPIHQQPLEDYYIDLYLKKINLVIECDENGHKDRKKGTEIERENFIKNKLSCKFYRYNPDIENFNINHTIADIISLIKN